MNALILAAGFSQRMGEITRVTPKTLLKIGDKTIFDILIQKLNKIKSIEKIYLLSNNYYYPKFVDWKEMYSGEKKIILLNNGVDKIENKKGFIGDLSDFVKNNQNENLIVIAADNLFDFELTPVVNFFHNKQKIVFGLIDVKDPKKLIGWEAVKINYDNKIVEIITATKNSTSSLTTFGLYIFPKNKLSKILEFSKNKTNSDSAINFINWISSNNIVYGFPFSGKWFDVGSPEILKKARKAFN